MAGLARPLRGAFVRAPDYGLDMLHLPLGLTLERTHRLLRGCLFRLLFRETLFQRS